ncbi:putative NAD dependent epimerase/dehydratase [Mariannaea sp. PMI_226]|nr:putative NAD dependent epimerase/dehydratase [Mariannaea sp. PMI_226]
MSTKLVTVVGATGQQGKAVIAAFANNPEYRIRGLTRNPDSASAEALRSQGIEIVKADIGDLDSLKSAFSGSHIIFAVTDFYELFQKYGPAKAKETETQQGTNLAKAASATSTLEHYIWSTLPNGTKEFPVPHFEGKFNVDMVIKADAALLAKTTFLLVCFYGNNLQLASFRPYWIETAKKYVQFTTYGPDTSIPFIGDVSNITPFIQAIVENPEETKNGTMVIGSVEALTAKEWVETWAKTRSAEVQLVRVSRQDYDALWPWPYWSEEFALMMAYFEGHPMSQWLEPGQKVHTAESLGITGLKSVEEWVKSWELPAP